MEDSPDIETASLPAVKNMRSKFEQMSLSLAPNGSSLGPAFVPRARATSGGSPHGGSDILKPPLSPGLRQSNSSSDLRSKKPPPPPPPSRSAKPSPAPSPSASPLLRPVPTPTHSSRSSLASIVALGEGENLVERPSTPSVSSLRNKFANNLVASPSSSKTLHTPKPSLSGLPAAHSEPELTGIHRPPPPPPIHAPPVIQHVFPSASDGSLSPERVSDSEESEMSSPPSLPPRPNHHRGPSSQTSSESEHHHHRPPPPPPSRRKSPPKVEASLPPPLPLRRGTGSQEELPAGPPPLPVRPTIAIPPVYDSELSESPSSLPSTSTVERRMFGNGRLPPPPTRTIALGEKLPPARRTASPELSSDEESGDEAQGPDLPDSSRSSRRPPVLSFRAGYVGPSEPKITVPAHHGLAIVSGTRVVVATHHHVKIYDVELHDIPMYSLDKREMGHGHGIREVKVTSMEYRPCAKPADRGALLWIGTKDGHIVELDCRSASVTAVKLSAHLHPITRIFRHGRSMATMDDTGKTLLFSPSDDGEDIQLAFTPPRIVRVTDKRDFAKMLAGKLWTATRVELHGARMQTLRVFDLFAPGVPTRSVLPLESVGAFTDLTMMPSQPDLVYAAHEAGSVSIWQLEEGGWPRCIEVVRVSTSDVLCLEGVNNRLWAGGRNGMISAYDVSVKPWVVSNCWMAHQKLPVNQLSVDHYGIERTGRLCVASVGRDEQIRLWDGLLASDWVDLELMKREASFSKFRDLSVLIVSWNCDSGRPDALTGDAANVNFLHDALTSVDSPDIIVFGFQELVDLESRKLVAKNVLLGRKDKSDASIAQITGLSGLSEKVTTAYRKWYDHLILAVRLAMPAQVPYSVIHTESLVGLFTCVFVKNSERMSVKDNVITSLKRGMGGRYGNKGGIITRLVIEDSSICFINCHLAAGQHATRARNADIAAMLEERSLLPESENEPLAYVGGGDGQMALDHEIVFLNGDMNYRIDQRREATIASVRQGDIEGLYAHDQLLKEIRFNRGCRLRGFLEGPLSFAPTYKYDRGTDTYDTSEKARAPAWCDRILWRTRMPNRVQQLHYRRYEANVSDHRPISAAFKITVKSLRHDVRSKAKVEVQSQWAIEQERLLGVSRDFYVDLALI